MGNVGVREAGSLFGKVKIRFVFSYSFLVISGSKLHPTCDEMSKQSISAFHLTTYTVIVFYDDGWSDIISNRLGCLWQNYSLQECMQIYLYATEAVRRGITAGNMAMMMVFYHVFRDHFLFGLM